MRVLCMRAFWYMRVLLEGFMRGFGVSEIRLVKNIGGFYMRVGMSNFL